MQILNNTLDANLQREMELTGKEWSAEDLEDNE